MIRESVTAIQALLIGGITFSWGLVIGNKKAEGLASGLMIICSIFLMATA